MTSSHTNTFIHLHTLDLRVHDSPSLHLSHDSSSSISKSVTHFLPIYIFDQRQLDLSALPNVTSSTNISGDRPLSKQISESQADLPPNPNHQDGPTKTRNTPLSRVAGFHRTSPHRLLHLLQSVFSLRETYRRSGGDLLIGYGKPEVLVPALISTLTAKGGKVEGVWAQDEVTVEEATMLARLRVNLENLGDGIKLKLNDSKTMMLTSQLPFNPRTSTPDVYTVFRKKVEGMGLNLGGGMFVAPLQTAKWSEVGQTTKEIKVSVGKEGRSLKPFPEVDLASLHLEQGHGGWMKAGENDNLDSLYALLSKPLLETPPIGGWSSSTTADQPPPLHPSSALPFTGGEEAALSRLLDYVGHDGKGGRKAKTYKATRNGLVGEAFSTKFSTWLSLGTLSAREAGWRVAELMESVGKNKDEWNNVYWIVFELLWRDFFQYTTLKYAQSPSSKSKHSKQTPSSTLFNPSGFSAQIPTYPHDLRPSPSEWHSPNWNDESDKARRWCEGRTGVPFIDANMRELRETGWMSNRGRQNVASFLVKDLYVDWRVGAEFFEMHLIDYDTCSNWGNWQYQAGVGNDPRSSRQFNPIKQAADYDPSGEYIRLWIPELKDLPDNIIQTPWLVGDQSKLKGYPSRPIIEQPQWRKHYGRSGGESGNSYRGRGGGRGGHGGENGRRGGGDGRGGGGRGGRGGNHH